VSSRKGEEGHLKDHAFKEIKRKKMTYEAKKKNRLGGKKELWERT